MTTNLNNDVANAWAVICAAIESNEPAGEIVIASGKDTGLYVRVKPSDIPAVVGLELVRQGIIKPLTDISKAPEDEGRWQFAHDRRLQKVANWKAGDYAVKGGGVADPVAAQMRVELEGQLKAKGLGDKALKEKGIKGNCGQMLDALIAAGVKLDKEAKMAELREIATKRLAERGKAAAGLDLSNLSL